jgi:hypothetical protein
VLEEVEMPPGFLDGVVHGASGGLALGAVEAGAGIPRLAPRRAGALQDGGCADTG